MSKFPWFKLYTEILHDPKMRRLTADEKWFWIVLLCLASESENRGTVSVTQTLPYDVTDFVHVCGYAYNDTCGDEIDPRDMITQALQKFTELGMIAIDEIGIITIKNFEKRQDTLLTPAERMKRYRVKKKVTQTSLSRNDGVTTVTLEREGDRDKEEECVKSVTNAPPTHTPEIEKMSEKEFAEYLRQCPAYRDVDVDRELQKLDAYLLTQVGKKAAKTRSRIISWLNNAFKSEKDDSPQEPKRLVPIFQPKPAEKIEPPPGMLRKLSQGIFKEVSQ